MPAPNLWIEWSDEVHKQVILDEATRSSIRLQQGASVLLRAQRTDSRTLGGRAADECAQVTLSPLETHFDLGGEFEQTKNTDALCGGFVDATDGDGDKAGHVRFRSTSRGRTRRGCRF